MFLPAIFLRLILYSPLRREIQPLDELARFLGGEFGVHAGVAQLDGERAIVADGVQGADDRFPIDAAVPRRAELPAAPHVAVGLIRIQDAALAIERQGEVL